MVRFSGRLPREKLGEQAMANPCWLRCYRVRKCPASSNTPRNSTTAIISKSATKTTADEAYAFWKTVKSAWPPTTQCKDDVATLNKILGGLGSPTKFANCKDGFAALNATYENFNCDIIVGGRHQIREVCCSQCGSQPIPDLPLPPAPSPPPVGDVHMCSLCGHTFNATEDAGGVAFADLPDSWRCPICGLPKSAYKKVPEDVQIIV